MKACLGRRG